MEAAKGSQSPVGILPSKLQPDLVRQLGLRTSKPSNTLVFTDWILYSLDVLVVELQESPRSPWNSFQGGVGVEVGARAVRRSWDLRRGFEVQRSNSNELVECWSVAIMNGAFSQGSQINPGSHLNDGRCEMITFSVPRPQRRELRIRMRSGSHFPHPAVTRSRGTSFDVSLTSAQKIWVDGQFVGRAERLRVSIADHPLHLCVPLMTGELSAT